MSSKKHNKNLRGGGKRYFIRPKQTWNEVECKWEKVK